MRESRSYGSVGEPVGYHRLYPEEAGGAIPPPTRIGYPKLFTGWGGGSHL